MRRAVDIILRAMEEAGAEGLVRRERCTTGETDWWYVPLDSADDRLRCEPFGGGASDIEEMAQDLPDLPTPDDIIREREARRGR